MYARYHSDIVISYQLQFATLFMFPWLDMLLTIMLSSFLVAGFWDYMFLAIGHCPCNNQIDRASFW